ncbi:hypothetical protein [Streptomyces sp. NPDC089919]|uniref:hypothetical protein n=1 Tax=Streptomyces sp. NPDC089919 TaxID=3155188 RepID=UPI00342821FD
MDISDEGQPFDPAWLQINDNVYGVLTAAPTASTVAERFIGAGWSSRSSSWESYELETSWCRIEVDPTDRDTLLHGVVDPQRFEELAALLRRFRLHFSLELYGEDDELLHVIEGEPPPTPQKAVAQPLSRRLARLGLWPRRGGKDRFRSG